MTLYYKPLQHGEFPTPNKLFKELDNEFNFSLDPCSTKENAKCKKYYTKKENGLIQPWDNEIVFMNPPYNQVKKWVEKAYYESFKNCIVVCLIPARTDTEWFHKYCLKGEIRFIKGRLKFIDNSPAPFPSIIVIFRNLMPENNTLKGFLKT